MKINCVGMDTILFAKRGVISGREMCDDIYTIINKEFNEISCYNDFSVF